MVWPKALSAEALVAVRALADRKVAAPALLALAADDRERDDDAIANFQLLVILSDLDDFAHELVAHDVAVLHPWHEPVVKMQIGTADRAAGHLHDRITAVFDLGIGHRLIANVFNAFPTQGFHSISPLPR